MVFQTRQTYKGWRKKKSRQLPTFFKERLNEGETTRSLVSFRKALFAALEGEEDYIEAPNLLSKINLYFT